MRLLPVPRAFVAAEDQERRAILRALWAALLLGSTGAAGGAVGQEIALAVNNPVITGTILFVLVVWQVVATRWAEREQQWRERQSRASTWGSEYLALLAAIRRESQSRARTSTWPEGDTGQPWKPWGTRGHSQPATSTWPKFDPAWHSFAGLHVGLLIGLMVGSSGLPIGPFLGLGCGMVLGAMVGWLSGRPRNDNPEISGTTAAAIIGGFLGLIGGLLGGVLVLESLDGTAAIVPGLFCFTALGAALGVGVGRAIKIAPLVRSIIGAGCGAVIGILGGMIVGICHAPWGSAWAVACPYIGAGIGGGLGLIGACFWPDRRQGA
jgi:hypothetical protein